DDEVWGVMDEALYLQAFVESAYRWNVIGFMSDIQHITLDQARAYFQTYYAPNNATLVLAGDVDPQDAFRLVERDFGAIPRRRPPRSRNASTRWSRGCRRSGCRTTSSPRPRPSSGPNTSRASRP